MTYVLCPIIFCHKKKLDLSVEGGKVRLKINEEKSNEMRINTNNVQEITVNGKTLEKVEKF